MKRSVLSTATFGLALLPASAAFAGPLQYELVDQGLIDPSFADKVRAEEGSARDFIELTGDGMVSQSFTLQHTATNVSAAMGAAPGLHLGIDLVTFPLGDVVNLVGKEENLSYSPVLPRLKAGLVMETPGRFSVGLGYSVVPPLPVGGASVLIVGADTSVGYTVHRHLRLGLELDVSAGQAIAPVTASKAQYEADPESVLANVDEERFNEVCLTQTYGCLDTLSIRHAGLQLTALATAMRVAHPYLKVGARALSETFQVQVDLSSHRVTGFLPTAGIGVALHPAPRLSGSVGLLTGFAPAISADDELDLLWRLELGLTWAL